MTVARPIEFDDPMTVWDMAFLGFSDHQIAEVLGCHFSAVSRRPDLQRIMGQARVERAEAIVALWRSSSQGSLRHAGRAEQLIEMVRSAEIRKIQRQRPKQRKNSGDPSGEYAKGQTIRAREERQPEG